MRKDRNAAVLNHRKFLLCLVNRMTQTLQPLSAPNSTESLCYYFNPSNQLQIVRGETQRDDWSFERVVFPGQRFFFAAPTQAKLAVYTYLTGNQRLNRIETVECDRLRVEECSSSEKMA